MSWHAAGIFSGLLTVALRLAVIYGVISAGYYTYAWFGTDWFRVFVLAAIALCLHLEIRRIERAFPEDADRRR
ncbi:MAG: hypothetical protein BroJett030_06670 [Alphaproteobacteria bacterium]|nr:MAG: hypothetical protein BroJett030_06670 [Alphaproteobacteria bacterium]